jgi:hypothetical protein
MPACQHVSLLVVALYYVPNFFTHNEERLIILSYSKEIAEKIFFIMYLLSLLIDID